MDFYTRQDDVGRRSRLFYFAFALAVVGAVIALYFVICFCFLSVGALSPFWPFYSGTVLERLFAHSLPPSVFGSPPQILAARPFLIITSLLTVFILAMSVYKTWHIRKGGGAYMAEQMGGKLLVHAGSFSEQRLLNVVEEMSVASNLPRPRVYILKYESSINAITAGLSHHDAIIAFTKGALLHLNRDEMQGVVAHEFAHILNGDYRLNLTMAGWLYGLIFFCVEGRDMMNLARDYMGRETKFSFFNFYRVIAVPMYAMGAVLWVGGWIGKMGAEIIQAAFSRQREHLADAFAVQFTRNPLGLAGALKKIAAAAEHGRVNSGVYMMMRSFFFVSPARFRSLWDSHPPLASRISQLDPAWDGSLPDLTKTHFEDQSQLEKLFKPVETTARTQLKLDLLTDGVNGLERDWGFVLTKALLYSTAVDTREGAASAEEHWGQALALAESLYRCIPEELRAAADDPALAGPLVLAVFLSDREADLRARQLEIIAALTDSKTAASAERSGRLMARANRLPLLGLASAALKSAEIEVRQGLERTVKALVAADNRLDLFEVAACQILKSALGLNFKASSAPLTLEMEVTGEDEALILSALAYVGGAQASQAQGAYQCGLGYLGYRPASSVLPREMITTQALGRAIDRLSGSAWTARRDLLRAMVAVAVHDQKIIEAEYEILRAVAAALDIQLPLFSLTGERPAESEFPQPGDLSALAC